MAKRNNNLRESNKLRLQNPHVELHTYAQSVSVDFAT